MCKRALALFAVLACLAPVGVASATVQGTTLLLSRSDGLGPLPAAGDNSAQTTQRALSGDGRFVVFQSGADDLGARDGFQHVWLRDTQTDTTTLIDRSPGGQPANGNSSGVSISRDGSAACFSSTANNLVAGVGPATTTGFISRGHVYVVRFASGSFSVADRASGAEGAIGDGGAYDCLIDSDGSRVAFDSDSKNLVAGDTNANADVFVRDLTAATTTRVSVTGPAPGPRWRAAADSSRSPATAPGSPGAPARRCSRATPTPALRHLRPRHVRGHDVPRQPGDGQRRRRRRLVRRVAVRRRQPARIRLRVAEPRDRRRELRGRRLRAFHRGRRDGARQPRFDVGRRDRQRALDGGRDQRRRARSRIHQHGDQPRPGHPGTGREGAVPAPPQRRDHRGGQPPERSRPASSTSARPARRRWERPPASWPGAAISSRSASRRAGASTRRSAAATSTRCSSAS